MSKRLLLSDFMLNKTPKEINTAVDFLVDTNDPSLLDQVVQSFGAVLVGGGMPGGYKKVEGHYVVRCLTNPEFVKFAMEQQGYGRIVGIRESNLDLSK